MATLAPASPVRESIQGPVIEKENRVAQNLANLIVELNVALLSRISADDLASFRERVQPFLAMIDPELVENQTKLTDVMREIEEKAKQEEAGSDVAPAEEHPHEHLQENAGAGVTDLHDEATHLGDGKDKDALPLAAVDKEAALVAEPKKRMGSHCCVAMITVGVATAAIAAGLLQYQLNQQ